MDDNCNSILPDSLTAGTTLSQQFTLTAYPATDWALAVLLRGPSVINLAAVPDPDGGVSFTLSSPAADTASWLPGTYWYAARATSLTDATQVFDVESAEIVIAPNLATAVAGYDGRSHAEKVLAAITAVIENRATMDQERYRINNRELYRTPVKELLALRSTYHGMVNAERRKAKGKPIFQQVRVRF